MQALRATFAGTHAAAIALVGTGSGMIPETQHIGACAVMLNARTALHAQLGSAPRHRSWAVTGLLAGDDCDDLFRLLLRQEMDGIDCWRHGIRHAMRTSILGTASHCQLRAGLASESSSIKSPLDKGANRTSSGHTTKCAGAILRD